MARLSGFIESGKLTVLALEGEGSLKLNMITLAIIAVFAVLFVRQASGLPWTPYRMVGLAIAGPALVLLIVARLQLGAAFSVSARASNLVTTGLYSRIRNPIYVFGALLISASSFGPADRSCC